MTHGISWHGMAINCSVDRSYFQHITACGLVGKGITSFSEILGRLGELVLHYCSSMLISCYLVQTKCVEQILLASLERTFQVQLIY